jgi:hypothetical protein
MWFTRPRTSIGSAVPVLAWRGSFVCRSQLAAVTLGLLVTPAVAHLDSGGGRGTTGEWSNHGSVGGGLATAVSTVAALVVRPGLIEVLYPPVMALDPELDSDGNGLPDAWEMEFFQTLGVDPAKDADGDGNTNWMEYLAGTHPRDLKSVFRPVVLRQGDEMLVTFPTVAGRDYLVRASPDLRVWRDLATLSGDGSVMTLKRSLAELGDRHFFRIGLSLTPPPPPP